MEEACLEDWILALNEGDSREREAACASLVAFGSPGIPTLVQAILDPESTPGFCEAVAKVLAHFGEEGIRPLIEAFNQPSLSARLSATYTLEQIGGMAVDSLIEALTRSERWIRLHAAMALGQNGESRAVPALIARLADDDREIRETAAFALGKIGIEALSSVLGATESPSATIRLGAIRALGKIGHYSAMPALGKILAEETDPLVKQAAQVALEGIMLQPGLIDTDL